MDVFLLRTLTEKSKLWFGKYKDQTVDDLIKTRATVYLRWVYYNYENITFTSKVLLRIHVPSEYKIEKPGKNPKLGEDVFHHNSLTHPKELKKARKTKPKKKVICLAEITDKALPVQKPRRICGLRYKDGSLFKKVKRRIGNEIKEVWRKA
jgi:hypothetical protein